MGYAERRGTRRLRVVPECAVSVIVVDALATVWADTADVSPQGVRLELPGFGPLVVGSSVILKAVGAHGERVGVPATVRWSVRGATGLSFDLVRSYGVRQFYEAVVLQAGMNLMVRAS